MRLLSLVILGVSAQLFGAQVSLRPGPGGDTLRRMCTGCHALDVVTGAIQTKAQWRTTVQDMMARGAKGTPSEVGAVVEYLERNYGQPDKAETAIAEAMPSPPAPAAAKQFDREKVVSRTEQWPVYGHDPGGQRYSPLQQINKQNVAQLERAWTFHTGGTGSEATPLVVDNRMYVTAPNGIFALEPETGKVIWKYASAGVARRGLAYWDGDPEHPRIFSGVEPGKMVALNAKTGKPQLGFGDNGLVNLRTGVAEGLPNAKFFLASPPVVYQNVVITGGNNGELAPSVGAYGDVRGWDARSGKLMWTFHTVARPGEAGSQTWAEGSWKQRSGTNVWGIMTVDSSRGLVFLPIGSPTSDMYGGDRHGNGLYGNSLVAIDALTGKVKWFQQLVHHDLWDYDPAAPPALVDVVRDGKRIAAVVQVTKMSLLFVFDRTTGEPLFGMREQAVPASTVPGEASSPTQPFPMKPPPLARMQFDRTDLYNASEEHARFCRNLLTANDMVSQGPYTPMPIEGNGLTFPSTLGGGNWGGVSYDPALGYVFTNVMNLGQWGHMVRVSDPAAGTVTYERRAGTSGAFGRFWDPESHIPCTKPPFGELVAVDINTAEVAWRTPLGRIPALEQKGVNATGALSMGGSIATAAGLVFIAATNDSSIRAFDSRTGKELWCAPLDTSAYAVPITFRGRDGRQYVAVVAGGTGFFKSAPGDSVIAFALPQ